MTTNAAESLAESSRQRMNGQISIRYRREESRWSARSLYDRLTRRFDRSRIFMETCRRLKIPIRSYLAAITPGIVELPVSRVAGLTAALLRRLDLPAVPLRKPTTAVNHALHRIRFTFHALLRYQRPYGKILLVSGSRQMLRRTQSDLPSVVRELSGTRAPTSRRCSSSRRELRVARAHHL